MREMKCECPRGMHPLFRSNCDPNDPAQDCFDRCDCNPGSTMMGTECRCDDPSQYVSLNGCVNDHSQDCHMPMSAYSKDHNACRTWEPCPMGDPMFEGCTSCGMTNMFDGKPHPMSCHECAPGYNKEDWKDGGERCVRHDMYWNCLPQPAMPAPPMPATTAGMPTGAMPATMMGRPALPQGPPECEKCFMVGHDVACGHCKPGFKPVSYTHLTLPTIYSV